MCELYTRQSLLFEPILINRPSQRERVSIKICEFVKFRQQMAHAILSISSAVVFLQRPHCSFFLERRRAIFRTPTMWALDTHKICVFHGPEKGLRVNFRKTSVFNHCQENGRVFYPLLPAVPSVSPP